MSLKLSNYHVLFPDGTPTFQPLSLTVRPGEILSLMGPSGCGKSTLLTGISGQLPHEFKVEGEIILDGVPIKAYAPHQRRIGLLFQDDLLFPHLTIWQNVAIALPKTLKTKSERKHAAFDYLDKVKLTHLADMRPEQVSGGQRARISLIRLLASEPLAILLDEPFSKLDAQLRETFRHWVFEQISQREIPCVMVTHDISDVPPHQPCLTWPWHQSSVQKSPSKPCAGGQHA